MDFSKEEKEAKQELEQLEQEFNKEEKKKNKRITTHVRMSTLLKNRVTNEAKNSGRSVSKLMDRIVLLYFKYNKSYEEEVL